MRRALGNAVPIEFHNTDMLSFLRGDRGTYDIVMASFSVHHLDTADTAEARIMMSTLYNVDLTMLN